MDYSALLSYHVEKQADMTISCFKVLLDDAKSFGVISTDEQNKVNGFIEKPANPEPMLGEKDITLASMGNYVFNTDFLYEQLQLDAINQQSSHDFGKDIIPSIIHNSQVYAYPFQDEKGGVQPYWRDVGTLDTFWEANLDLVDVVPELDLYDENWPILTYQAQLSSAKFLFRDEGRKGQALDSVVSGGCIISGSTIERALLFSKVRVRSYAKVEESVVLPEVEIGRSCRIRNAIIDRGCKIPPGTVIGEDLEADAQHFRVTPKGIVLVTPDMLGQKPDTLI